METKNPTTARGGGSRKRGRLGRSEWLAEGLKFLKERGIDGVRVVPLARSLGVTSGSFYWHFRDRRDLHSSLLSYWETWSTEQVVEHVSSAEGDPRDRLRRLMEFVVEGDLGRYDTAMRAWALQDETVARAVARSDQRRVGFVTSLFRESGFDRRQAD